MVKKNSYLLMEKKKYFIGWMPTDSQSELLGCITLEISRKFSLKDVSKTHPFHLTAKVPFLATEEERGLVSKTLNAFTHGLSKFSLQTDGYGHFGNTVIYADIIHDSQMGIFLSIQKRLYESLFMHNAWMSFDRFEPLVRGTRDRQLL